ncbi:MAG: SAP domain-containing protein [Candidatus Thalassarchaeaceae archaeon]|nr:SAP domain-containing protein [Candidatus Thalassarchaeaceae archaeon]
MADDESFSFDSLSKLKVSELREICKNSELLISGNKAELIVRILENSSENQEDKELFLEEDIVEMDKTQSPVIETKGKTRSPRDIDDAIDRLISRVDGKESINIPPEEIPKNDVMEAEILEAEIFENPAPSVDEMVGESLILDEEDSWGSTEFTEVKKEFIGTNEDIEKPSLTITLPSLDILKTYWPQISAVFVVILLVGTGVFYFLSSDSSFQARPLNYEDSMTFTLSDGLIELEGDEMVSLLRDSLPDTAIQDACNRLTVNIGGTGSIEIIKGNNDEITHPEDKTVTDLQGTVSTKDAYGRSHLTVQQRVTHSLTVDLEGKTWRDTNVCGNLGWSLSGNQLEMTTDIYDELAEHSILRSESAISFTDIDGARTDANIVTFGVDGFSNLDGIATLLTFPLTPIELHEFFGDIKLESGMTSDDLSDWNNDWKWSVGSEQRKDGYGLVYPVEISHTEVERCLGRMNIDILVKNGVPWPVEQIVDVLIDKDQGTSDCSFIESTATDAALPEGTLRINMKMSEITSDSGSKSISWGSTYVSRPGPGEDKLSESAKKDWSTAMWDESEIRSFSLEDAINCLRANHSNRDITVAIDSDGYIWQGIYSYNEDSNGGFEEWNLSWVRSDETSGWAIVRQNDECSFENERRNDGEITWNQDAIPSTHTLKNLEDRILDDNRYENLQVSHDLVGTTYGYRLSVSEDNDLFSFLPGDLTEGQVLVVGSREWTDSNREHNVNFAMDAQTGRMLAWAEVIG